MSPRFMLPVIVASVAIGLFAEPSFAQSLSKLAAAKKAAAGKNAKQPVGDRSDEVAPKKPMGDRGDDVANLTPAQMAARQRLAELEKQFQMVDQAIEAHERRIRAVRSIRVPPGVRPPQVDPVPAELLQMRAGLWNAMQAIRDAK